MIKIKRLLSNIIDYMIVFLLSKFIFDQVYKSFRCGNNINICLFILFVILIFLIIVFRDCTFQKKSFGKYIMKIYAFNINTHDRMTNKESIIKNAIDVIFLPISIFSIIFINKSFGDYICKLDYNFDNEFVGVTKYDILKNKKSKLSLLGKIILLQSIIILSYIFLIFVFFQKLNYYSLRIIIVITLMAIYLIIYFVLLFNLSKRGKNLSIFTILILVLFIYSIDFERYYIYFSDIKSALYYFYPKSEIIYEKCDGEKCFVFYQNLYSNEKELIYLNKPNKIWNIHNNKNIKRMYKKRYIENGKQYTIYVAHDKNDSSFIIVDAKDDNSKIYDSLGNEFSIMKYEKEIYYYILTDKNDDNYIFINDKKYDF